jgi:hypothetical protein
MVQKYIKMRMDLNNLRTTNLTPQNLESSLAKISEKYDSKREARPSMEPSKGWKDVEEWKRRI